MSTESVINEIAEALAFEQSYAKLSGVTVEWLREHGRVVAPCDCAAEGCHGWQSIPRDILDDYQAMGRVSGAWSWPPEIERLDRAEGRR